MSLLRESRERSMSLSLYNSINFQGFLAEELKRLSGSEDLSVILSGIEMISKEISTHLLKGETVNGRKSQLWQDYHGYKERMQSVANNLFLKTFQSQENLRSMVSSSIEGPVEVNKDGKYVLFFVALDAPDNIECNLPVGTLFHITKKTSSVEDFLKPGRDSLAAGYILYSSSTTFVLTLGRGVYSFTLDPETEEFWLTHRDIHFVPKGNTYCVNEGNMYQWDPPVAEYVENKKSYKTGKAYQTYYIGSLAGDMHRILKNGGILLHPSVKNYPQGKLRLLSECVPMAFIAQQAGGLASDGKACILDITPGSITQTSQMFLGSRDDVRDLITCYKNFHQS